MKVLPSMRTIVLMFVARFVLRAQFFKTPRESADA